jgi:sulfur-oxidizing protein SoxZ
MSERGFVRTRVPRAAKPGEVIRVRMLIVHPMEGIERDAAGNVLARPYNFIYRCAVYFNGRPVLTITPTQSVSANPYFSFPLRVTAAGTLRVVFEDSAGQQYEDSKRIELA